MRAPPPPPARGEGTVSRRESRAVLCNCLMLCNDRWIIVIKAFIRIQLCFGNGSVKCLKLRGREGIVRTCEPSGKYLQRRRGGGCRLGTRVSTEAGGGRPAGRPVRVLRSRSRARSAEGRKTRASRLGPRPGAVRLREGRFPALRPCSALARTSDPIGPPGPAVSAGRALHVRPRPGSRRDTRRRPGPTSEAGVGAGNAGLGPGWPGVSFRS